MTSILHVSDANQLLAKLPTVERDAFMSACETVALTFGEVLVQPTEAVSHVYFPLDSFISLIVILDPDNRLEVAMTGREGMLGSSLVLGIDEAPLLALVQGAGSALRMNAASFQALLLSSPVLHQRLKHYLYVVMKQLAHSTACIHFHQIEARLARWLLMTQDRARTDQLKLTHEFLAMMLGVRRAGITMAAIALQTRGLIGYHRGEIKVLDRAGLIGAACECYNEDRALYAKMMTLSPA
ncbi:Crp/Fnr family transcriptional regulator [Halomonas sp. HL-93]|uniref:Crp/Fnr family transcriptional regulator n=1 Tax=Halomonas sp. HL-93 TaxID=1666906 RepID=UPI0006D96138|nr:Crp/Fnr family transcriptional regulator [Halomonas sp. HL-93]KPQ20912.1 MAG: cAMP-binding putative transcriptional regulator [Halomonas sp. HL-93]SBR46895.1 cAMP-binding domain of CRP or a regulatory subunit of cAMP-dependent protein kinases [Halomonas sp. HL-93]